MSIQQTNPLTNNSNVVHCEVGDNGFVSADLDTGLLYGTVQLPGGTDPDAWFQSLTGKERPGVYKKQLAEIASDHKEADAVPDVVLKAAQDILNPDTPTHVLVTTLNIVDVARRFGLLSSTSAHSLDITTPGDLARDGIEADGTPAAPAPGTSAEQKGTEPQAGDEQTTVPPPADQQPGAEQVGNGKSGKKGKDAVGSAISVPDSESPVPTNVLVPAPEAPGDGEGASGNAPGVIAGPTASGTDAEGDAEAARLSAFNESQASAAI